jgi:hypothetical protein
MGALYKRRSPFLEWWDDVHNLLKICFYNIHSLLLTLVDPHLLLSLSRIMSKEDTTTNDETLCNPWKVVFEGNGWNSTTFVVDMSMLAKHSLYFRALLEGQYSEGADQLVSLEFSQLGNVEYRRVISGFSHWLAAMQAGGTGPWKMLTGSNAILLLRLH